MSRPITSLAPCRGHFDRLTPMAAAEIENRFVSNLIPDPRTKQRFDLAAALATAGASMSCHSYLLRIAVARRAAYQRHFLTPNRKL